MFHTKNMLIHFYIHGFETKSVSVAILLTITKAVEL